MTRDVRPSRFKRMVAGTGALLMALAIGLPPFTASTPVSAANPPLDDVIDVEAGGDFACAIVNEDPTATTGSVWCWGNNFDQQLGNGSTDQNSTVATKVSAVENGFSNSSVSLLALGVNHACAVESGDLYCWGSNKYGKAGKVGGSYGDFDRAETPTLIDKPSGVTSWDSLALGKDFTCALTTKNGTTGVLYCWGHGNYLGNGALHDLSKCTDTGCSSVATSNDLDNPTPVLLPPVSSNDLPNEVSGTYSMFYDTANSGFESLDAGLIHACALKPSGAEAGLYCWGENSSLQTNWNADYQIIWKPAKFVGAPQNSNSTLDASGSVRMATSAWGACIEKTSGVFCIGSPSAPTANPNYRAALDGSNSPVTGFEGLELTRSGSGSLGCGIRSTEIWCFGDFYNASVPAPAAAAAGEIGSSTSGTTDISLGGGNVGSLACAVNNRLAYCWGSSNSSGQLGNNTTTTSATPVQVLLPVPPAAAPTDLVATAGDGSISIAFTPGATNGWAVTTMQYSLDGGTTWSMVSPAGLSSPVVITRQHNMQPLQNGQSYSVLLRQHEGGPPPYSIPAGDPSAAVTATPAAPTAPGSPTGVTAAAGDTSATVSWTAPTSNGGAAITSYTVTASPGGATCTTADGTTTTCDVTGLTNGTAYTFTVIATNSVGNSAASTASAAITPAGVSGAPTGATATAGDASATVSWTAPTSNGGAAITSYTVTASPGGATCTTADGTTTTCNVTGLTNGTAYTFTVIATNSVGNSAASAASTAITPAASSTDSGSNTDEGSDTSTDTETETDTSTDTGTDTGSTADDTTSDELISTPETATTSEAVTDDDATELASEPGDGKVIVDGAPVTPTVSRVADDAVNTPPAERTPEQVAAIQQSAQELVDGFNDIAGEDSPVEVTNTETGAVITGLLTNLDDPDTPVEVPAERVLVMTAGDLAVMAVATDDGGDTLPLDNGSLQVSSDGNIAMAVAGLPASTAGEIVMLPSRTVLGTFTTSADGVLTGEITIPTSLAAGDYGIAIAVGTSRMSLGVRAPASPATLPATGTHPAPLAIALALLAGGLLLSTLRRRTDSKELISHPER